MRILTLTNWYPPHHRGGYEWTCGQVMTRLAERGHDVLVLCSDERFADVAETSEPLPVRRELRMYWKNERPWRPGIRGQLEIERHNQAALERALDEHQPDVVSAWHMAAFSLNLLTSIHRRGTPISYAICDVWPSYTLTMDPWAKRFRGRLRGIVGNAVERRYGVPSVLPEIDEMGFASFLSKSTRDDVRVNSPWRFPNADVIYPGIDRASLAATGNIPPRTAWKWELAYLGRFDARKGTETLVRALPLLPKASLVMYGRDGDEERQRLVTLAESLGVADRLSFGPFGKVGEACRRADCVIFPSEWPEPFGLIPLESMECDTPVVATGTGGSGEFLVDGENCLLMAPGDPASLAAAVERLAADPALRDRLRVGGRKTAAEFDIVRTVDGYEHRFESLIEDRIRAGG